MFLVVSLAVALQLGRPSAGDLGRERWPAAFARYHAFPAGKWQLLKALDRPGVSQQDRESMLLSLKDAYVGEMRKWGGRKQWERALAEFREMESKVQPDVTCYTAAIQGMENHPKAWSRALGLFHEMQERGLTPTLETCNRLISASSKGLQWKLAVDVLQDMRQLNVQEDAETIASVFAACERGGLWAESVALLQDMLEREEEVPRKYYGQAMQACELARQYEEADWVEEEAAMAGYQFNL